MKKITKTNKKSAVRRKDVRRPVVKNAAGKKSVVPTNTPHVVTTTFTTTTTITPGGVKAALTPISRRTLVSFILDETGSMQGSKQVTINGFNEYIQTLKAKGGDILFTLTKFNTMSANVVHSGVPLEHVVELNHFSYQPNFGTPLFDAIGRTIASIDREIVHFDEKPAVLVVIMTDGEENGSREYTRESVFALIKAKEALGWGFIYLGANQDAYKSAASFGLGANSVANYSVLNTVGAFAGVANATALYSSSVTRGLKVDNTCTLSSENRQQIEQGTERVGHTTNTVLNSHTSSIPLTSGLCTPRVGDVVVGSVSSADIDAVVFVTTPASTK